MGGSRHARQVVLPEIGEAGQARLAAATATVHASGAAGTIEAQYLAGAGVGRLVVPDQAIADAACAVDPCVRVETDVVSHASSESPPFDVRDPSARDVATGAWRALATLRALLASRLRLERLPPARP